VLACAAAFAADRIFPPDMSKVAETSVRVAGSDGTILRSYLTQDGAFRLPATLDDVDRRYVELLLAYEDRRFLDHHGVDLLAGVRALWQLTTNLRVVSGASTLTMQVARLLGRRRSRRGCRRTRSSRSI
jgi:penicillin-binding protein 1C